MGNLENISYYIDCSILNKCHLYVLPKIILVRKRRHVESNIYSHTCLRAFCNASRYASISIACTFWMLILKRLPTTTTTTKKQIN